VRAKNPTDPMTIKIIKVLNNGMSPSYVPLQVYYTIGLRRICQFEKKIASVGASDRKISAITAINARDATILRFVLLYIIQ
jgi:hypothetical protein